MNDRNGDWQAKAATLSDKTARREFGLTQSDILRAIRAGKLQCRVNSVFGNPYLRLLRREVEALVATKHGANYLADRQTATKLTSINRELRQLKDRIAVLEKQKSELNPTEPASIPAAPLLPGVPKCTAKQGQYLAFIYHYTRIHRQPPAEADLRRFFEVSPPVVHAMILTLERRGLITRTPGHARSAEVRISRGELPELQ